MFTKFYSLICCLLLTQFSIAQIIINEYSASNLRQFSDEYQNDEDWIELYNAGSSDVDISDWYLSDRATNPTKWRIPQNIVIASHSYLIFWASGRDSKNPGGLHTNFKFTQTNGDEFVVLANEAGVVIESTPLVITQVMQSMGKDDMGVWKIYSTPTPGFSNDHIYYSSYSKSPVIKTAQGFYVDLVNVVIDADLGIEEKIYYTTDGSEPTESSNIYTGSLTLQTTAVVKARVISSDPTIFPSKIDFATFFIDEPSSTMLIVSVAGAEAIELADGNRDLNPRSTWEIFNKDGKFMAKSLGELDSHGQDSWVNPQRSLDWISRDQMGYDSGIEAKLFDYSDRDKYQRIVLRASGDDNYPSVGNADHEGSTHIRDEYVHTLVQSGGMHMDVRALTRCILYLNGKYWGVYTMREKPDDHDYTDHVYNQDEYDLQFLKTWGQSWAEYGGDRAFKDWSLLRDHILQNDMSIVENYQKVKDEMDVISLMDYMLANLSCVSSDWLNYNTGWWRGLKEDGGHKKWGYIMWDNDATFDYYINYSGVPNTSPTAQACDIEDISDFVTTFFPQDTSAFYFEGDSFFIDGEWIYFEPDTIYSYPDVGKHEQIFEKLLLESPEFRNQYYARYTDMINTVFSCNNMEQKLDSLIAIISPEMPRHINRWGGSMAEWKSNIEKLKSFVKARCKAIDDGLQDCYNLTGPYDVTIITDPPNSAPIQFNSLVHQTLPWSGPYFGNMANTISVDVTVQGFKKWKSKNGSTSFTNETALFTELNLTDSDTLIAIFEGSTAVKNIPANAFEIAPNPSIYTIEIDYNLGSNASYSVSSMEGKFVLNGTLDNKISKQILDISSLAVGTYLFTIEVNGYKNTKRFVVMK